MKEANKWICMMAYIIFFLPLIINKESEAYRYHSNQGLNLVCFSLIVSFLGFLVPVVGWFVIFPVGIIFTCVLWIIGLYNAYCCKNKELPVIGKYKWFK